MAAAVARSGFRWRETKDLGTTMDRNRDYPRNMPAWLPSRYAGKRIKKRNPYTMPGELVVPNGGLNQPFPAATFLHTIDLTFEVWGVVVRASQSVAAAPFIPIADPAPSINKFWRIRMQDQAYNQAITKAAQLVGSLVDTNTDVWNWDQPMYLVNGQGYEISVDNLLAANALRAEITFRGYLCVLEPPSETR